MAAYEGASVEIVHCSDEGTNLTRVRDAFRYLDLNTVDIDLMRVINIFGAADVLRLMKYSGFTFGELKKHLDKMIEYKLIYGIKLTKEGFQDYFIYCLDHFGEIALKDLGEEPKFNYLSNIYLRCFKAHCLIYKDVHNLINSFELKVFSDRQYENYKQYMELIEFKTNEGVKPFVTTSYELLQNDAIFKELFYSLEKDKVVICMYKDSAKGLKLPTVIINK